MTIFSRRRFSRTAARIPARTPRRPPTWTASKFRLSQYRWRIPADPSHTHASLLGEWNSGKMDGFGTDKVRRSLRLAARPPPGFPYAYVPDSETTIYHLLAAHYALADENFAPRLVPTLPEPLHAGDRAEPHRRQSERPHLGLRCQAGNDCSDLRHRRRRSLRPGVFPCFDQPTIADLLDARARQLEVLYRRVQRRRESDGQRLRRVPQDSLRARLEAQRRHAVGQDSERHRELPACRKSPLRCPTRWIPITRVR